MTWQPIDTARTRADRLVQEFTEGATRSDGYNIRAGLAQVLEHLIVTEADQESFYAIPRSTLQGMADALTAPTLLDRALAGDAQAARQFLHEGGFTDENGNLLPHLRPCQD